MGKVKVQDYSAVISFDLHKLEEPKDIATILKIEIPGEKELVIDEKGFVLLFMSPLFELYAPMQVPYRSLCSWSALPL